MSPKVANNSATVGGSGAGDGALYNRDISLGIVGESHAGKSTLVEALRGEKGISPSPDNANRERSQFEVNGL